MLIEREGATAALRSGSGNLVFPPATAAGYSVDNWLLADGDERDATAAADEPVFRCDLLGCIGVVKGKTVALIRNPGALERIAAWPISSSRRSLSARSAGPRALSSIGAC